MAGKRKRGQAEVGAERLTSAASFVCMEMGSGAVSIVGVEGGI